jgi:hypothetical protein
MTPSNGIHWGVTTMDEEELRAAAESFREMSRVQVDNADAIHTALTTIIGQLENEGPEALPKAICELNRLDGLAIEMSSLMKRWLDTCAARLERGANAASDGK